MFDYLVRAIAREEPVRIAAVVSTGVVDEARRRHGTYPVATAALGRAFTAGLLLATEIKGEDLLTIRILGDGPLGALVVSADARGGVRGYVQNPKVDLPPDKEGKLPVGTAVGKGVLHVAKDLGLKEPFVGSSELVSGEIAEDIAYYLYASEQIPSALTLGVLVGTGGEVRSAGGVLVQVLGDVDDETKDKLAERFSRLQAVSRLIEQGYSPENLIDKLQMDYKILSTYPVKFSCRCNKQKVEEMLFSLGAQELKDLLEREGRAEVSCHFCGETYIFDRPELEKIITEVQES